MVVARWRQQLQQQRVQGLAELGRDSSNRDGGSSCAVRGSGKPVLSAAAASGVVQRQQSRQLPGGAALA